MLLAHQILGHEPGAPGGGDEGAAGAADRTQAIHGGFKMVDGTPPRVILDRPSTAQPISRLFDGREFLHVPFRRHDEGQGFPPMNFDQVSSFG